jgi:LuxR family transcriptional regulator, maltose regulon positive regulatory protein
MPYAGIFLPEDNDAPPRCASSFARASSGRELEQASQHEDAATLYQRGLDADDLAEAFYQGLMRCHAATGRTADATATYQKLKQRLSISFGLKPSAVTERLYQSLRGG